MCWRVLGCLLPIRCMFNNLSKQDYVSFSLVPVFGLTKKEPFWLFQQVTMGLVYKGRWGTHAQTNESFYTGENEKTLWQKFALQKREEIQVEKNCRTQHVPPNFALSRIQIPFVHHILPHIIFNTRRFGITIKSSPP
jgi:hypothetical protein